MTYLSCLSHFAEKEDMKQHLLSHLPPDTPPCDSDDYSIKSNLTGAKRHYESGHGALVDIPTSKKYDSWLSICKAQLL
jgi:hypothetical protein